MEQTHTAIDLRGIEKTFRSPAGPVKAVRGVDVAISPGEVVALLGPNGAGKSTTIDVLLGLTKPDAGTASLFGVDPAQAVKAGKVAGMLQVGVLPRDLSVRELVTVMASLYPKPLGVDEALQTVGISRLAERRTQKLSGGETQRVRFALALVSNPDCSCSTSPRRRWTSRAVTSSGRRCAISRRSARRCFSRRTTWKRRICTPTVPC